MENQLEAELQRLREVRAIWSTSDDLTSYLNWLRSKIRFLSLLRGESGTRAIDLDSVYTPLPCRSGVSIHVADGQVNAMWRVSTAAGIAPLSAAQRPEGPLADFGDASPDALAGLQARIQAALDDDVDPDHPTVGTRPLPLVPSWYPGRKDAFWPLGASECVSLYDRVAVLGPPGSGKSTFCRYLALRLIEKRLEESPNSVHGLNDWPHGPLVPVYIELRRLWSLDGLDTQRPNLDADVLWNYLSTQLKPAGMEGSLISLQRELHQHGAVLIFDGVDEIPKDAGQNPVDRHVQLTSFVEHLRSMYPKARFVLTCRDRAYPEWRQASFNEVLLAPLSLTQARELLTRLARERGLSDAESEVSAEELLRELERVPAALRDYPLFLTLMAALEAGDDKGIPTRSSILYQRSIALLLNRWSRDADGEPSLTSQLGCTNDDLLRRLEAVAFATHLKGSADPLASGDIDLEVLLVELFRMGQGVDAHRVVGYLTQQAGVIVARDPETFQFAHRGFQEYLAAAYLYREIAEAGLSDDSARSPVRKLSQLLETDPSRWREPAIFVGDLIAAGRNPRHIWAAIDELLPDADPEDGAPPTVWWSIWLAARFLLDHHPQRTVTRLHRPLIPALAAWMVKALETSALPKAERVEIGRALGVVGDERQGVGLGEAGVPDPAWCRIESGRAVVGTTDAVLERVRRMPWAAGWQFGRERPPFEASLEPFEVSRYAITQTQYSAFVNSPDGYADDRWWPANARRWRDGARPHSAPSWGVLGNLPQTDVAWYEAKAFTRWLSYKTSTNIDLPTEIHWEAAARRCDERVFSWGDEFDDERCNSNTSTTPGPVPVGCLLGVNDRLPEDMNGNVWEWCSNVAERGGIEVNYPLGDGIAVDDPGDDTQMAVRGGSYLNPPFLLRSSYRGRDLPNVRQSRSGFRVVRAIPDGRIRGIEA